MNKRIKINLNKGVCSLRWTCKNINKKCCKPLPKPCENFVLCSHYEKNLKRKDTEKEEVVEILAKDMSLSNAKKESDLLIFLANQNRIREL